MGACDIRYLLWDVGNVLRKYSWTPVCGYLAAYYSPLSSERIGEILEQEEHRIAFEKGSITTGMFYERFARAAMLGDKDPACAFTPNALEKAFAEGFGSNPGIGEIVGRIAPGIKQGFLSTSNEINRWHFFRDHEMQYVLLPSVFIHKELHIFSYQVGEVKPHPRIFEAALRACGCDPEYVLFIDDRLDYIKEWTGRHHGSGIVYDCTKNSIEYLADALASFKVFK